MNDDQNTKTKRIISMRLIVSVATVALLVVGHLVAGTVAEKNARESLTKEIENRLVQEARNLAFVSVGALFEEFPELTLHPLVKGMQDERPDLALVLVVDHEGIVQGHADVAMVGKRYQPTSELIKMNTSVGLSEGEELWRGNGMIVVSSPVVHAAGKRIGTAWIGTDGQYVDSIVVGARKKLAMFLLPILVIATVVALVMMSRLLEPIAKIRVALDRIGDGDLSSTVELSSRTEIGLLASSINDMTAKLRSAQTHEIERERLDHEMKLARDIQRGLLPTKPLEANGYVVRGAQQAAAEVGGDYFDILELPHGRVGLLIADVSGKGLAGCLVTSMLAVLARTMCPAHDSPASLLLSIEAGLEDSLQAGTFVTVFYGILDPERHTLVYASAGHNPLYHYVSQTQELTEHKTESTALGLFAGALRETLTDHHLELEAGDVVVQMTDGVNEAFNTEGEQFGFDKTRRLISECAQTNDELTESLLKATKKWEGHSGGSDDKTVLVLQRVAPENVRPEGGARQRDLGAVKPKHALSVSVSASMKSLKTIGEWFYSCLADCIEDKGDRMLLVQGLYEVCANIIEHGCKCDESKRIELCWISRLNLINVGDDFPEIGYVMISDDGAPPHWQDWPHGDLDLSRVKDSGRGIGLHIIRETLPQFEFLRSDHGVNVSVFGVNSLEARVTKGES